MQCPYCGSTLNRVVDSREATDAIRRRRQCESCDQRFTTYERAESVRMHVVKRDGRKDPFDRDKLLRGLQRAAAKLQPNGWASSHSAGSRGWTASPP
jgi:transcriptional repressor NrdR